MAEVISFPPSAPKQQRQLTRLLAEMGRVSIYDVSDVDLAVAGYRNLPVPVVYLQDANDWAALQENGRWVLNRADFVKRGLKVLAERWRRAGQELRDIGRSMSRDEGDQAKALREEADACIKIAKRLESKAAGEVFLPLAADHIARRARQSDFDLKSKVVGCQNGAFDLELGEFFNPVPDDFISKACKANFNPFAKCPTWLAVLERITEKLGSEDRAEMLDYLQCIAGRCAIHEVGGRFFVFFGGPPGTGKSVFLNTIQRVLGDYAVALAPASLMSSRRSGSGPSPDILEMNGARMILVPEVENTDTFDIAGIKRISGGDSIKARDLNKGIVTFDVGGLICMTGNTFAKLPSISDSFISRLKIVMFDNPVPKGEQDIGLTARLEQERDGILSWILVGAMKYSRGEMVVPSIVDQNVEQFRNRMDTIGLFLGECCDKGDRYSVRKEDLLISYNNWADRNGYRLYGKRGGDFAARLEELGYQEKRVDGCRSWAGISVKAEYRHEQMPFGAPITGATTSVSSNRKGDEEDGTPQYDV